MLLDGTLQTKYHTGLKNFDGLSYVVALDKGQYSEDPTYYHLWVLPCSTIGDLTKEEKTLENLEEKAIYNKAFRIYADVLVQLEIFEISEHRWTPLLWNPFERE